MLWRSLQKALVSRHAAAAIRVPRFTARRSSSSLSPINVNKNEINSSERRMFGDITHQDSCLFNKLDLARSVFGGTSPKEYKKMSERILDDTVQVSTSRNRAQLLREKFGVSANGSQPSPI